MIGAVDIALGFCKAIANNGSCLNATCLLVRRWSVLSLKLCTLLHHVCRVVFGLQRHADALTDYLLLLDREDRVFLLSPRIEITSDPLHYWVYRLYRLLTTRKILLWRPYPLILGFIGSPGGLNPMVLTGTAVAVSPPRPVAASGLELLER